MSGQGESDEDVFVKEVVTAAQSICVAIYECVPYLLDQHRNANLYICRNLRNVEGIDALHEPTSHRVRGSCWPGNKATDARRIDRRMGLTRGPRKQEGLDESLYSSMLASTMAFLSQLGTTS